ncbi:MAG: PEP-CTERM sorting domain-containing protein [Planctomycetaceae bacterium]
MVHLRWAVCLGVTVWLGILSTDATAAYLFRGTGGTPNYLIVTTDFAETTLSTATNPIDPGSNNQGWWSHDARTNSNGNDSFEFDRFPAQNNYFTFDISALSTPTVTGLVLNIQHPGANFCPMGYYLYDVSTAPTTLATKIDNPNEAIFHDLGSGKLYGKQGIPQVNLPEYWIPLNADAVADLNQAILQRDTYFSIGGTGWIPEPSTVVLSAMGGLVLMGLQVRRRKRLPGGC